MTTQGCEGHNFAETIALKKKTENVEGKRALSQEHPPRGLVVGPVSAGTCLPLDGMDESISWRLEYQCLFLFFFFAVSCQS